MRRYIGAAVRALRFPVLGLAVTGVLAAAACGGDDATPTPEALSGGVLAEFEHVGESFHVWVTNPDTIDQLIALRDGTASGSFPNGRILRGPGAGNHNEPWSWHLDPEDIDMADLTIEVCDGEASYVEENLDEYVDTVQRYCPWGAELVSLDDRR